MKIKMISDQAGAANGAGSVSKTYLRNRVYSMDEPWQQHLANIFVDQIKCARYLTTRGRGRPAKAKPEDTKDPAARDTKVVEPAEEKD